ncbi:MAG: phosphate regulon sensor protein PhoR, partial [Stenotrophobium sp.]
MTADSPSPQEPQNSPGMLAAGSLRRRVLSFWFRECLRVTLGALIGALIGEMFGHSLIGSGLAVTAYFMIHLWHLAELRAWAERPKLADLPEPGGIWGDVFDRLLDMRRRNRKKTKRLSAMLSEFQASTAALPDGAVVLGPRGEIAWFNEAAQILLGLRSGADVGVRIPNLIRFPAFTDYFIQGDYRREVEAPSPVNPRNTLSLRVVPYGNNQRLLIVRDISELKRLETARRDFVANASHELRTPLTVLRGYLDMIEPETQGKGALAQWRTPISEMRNQATRMESLVRDMLRLARLEADAPARQESLDVPSLVQRVVDEARALSQGSHRFETSVQSGLFLLGDEGDVLSIFSNLVSNAVRYTPAGGLIRVIWVAEEGATRFTVSDTGIGIAEKDMPRLTERFYRI